MNRPTTPAVDDASQGLFAQTMQVAGMIRSIIFAGALLVVLASMIPDTPVIRLFGVLVMTLMGACVVYAASACVLSVGQVRDVQLLRRANPRVFLSVTMIYAIPVVVMTLLEKSVSLFTGGVESMTILAGFGASVACLVVFARYGTIVPALIDGGNPSPQAARQRGRMGAVFWRLVGVSLFLAATAVGMTLLVALFSSLVFVLGLSSISVVMGALMRGISAVVVVGSLVAMAVVLCNAYRGTYDTSSA